LDACEPDYEQRKRNPNDDAGNSKRALHDLTRTR
jgi:hypothetical protein